MSVIRCILCGELFSKNGNHSKLESGMLKLVCPRCRAKYKGRERELENRLIAISRSAPSM